MTEEPIADTQEVYLRIKEKRERHAEKVNSQGIIVKFNRRDLVLVKACRISDAYQKIISKCCDLFEGPYKIGNQISNSTYELLYLEPNRGTRGVFNVRQLKRYHAQTEATQ